MNIWHISLIFKFIGVLVGIFGFSHGQSLYLVSPTATERGSDTVYTCTVTGGSSPYVFIWQDVSRNNLNIFASGVEVYPDGETRYLNFEVSEDGAGTTIMTIVNTQIEDEGSYRCGEKLLGDEREFTVEVRYTLELSVASTVESNNDIYTATCDAVQGRPNVTITWMLGTNEAPCDNPVVTYMQAPPDLFSKRSVCTFQATSENYGETLRCIISGHQLTSLNGEETFILNIHSVPASTGIMTVGFQFQDPDLRVSCDIDAANQPNPSIRNYYIYSNGTSIHSDTTAVDFVVVPESEFDIYTEFYCVAGNYLGNTTSPTATYHTGRKTSPSPTSEPILTERTTSEPREPIEGTTPEPRSEEPSPPSCICNGLSSGASAGIAIVAILLVGSIIINVIQFIVWRRHSTDENGSQKATSSDVRGGSNEASDNMAYEMIQSGDRAYTALKFSSSRTSRSATIDPEHVTFFTRLGSIGRGDFGTVWKGELRSNQGQAAVTIRQIPDNVSKSTNVPQSVKVLCGLSDQQNVVKCLGFCQEQSSIIYEFISGGTLLTHLQMTGVQSQSTYSNLKPNRAHIDEGSLLNFAWQIAKGMQFLASKKIIHGTLCAHNVLLGDRKQCKLSDYGLASSLFSNRGKPTRWSSPETMVTGVQSTEGDIWSFGIVLWEIVTLGARPYPNMTFDTVQKEVSDGYKMPRPRHCGQELYTMMSRCWETEGRNRIRFNEILKTLERILEKTHDYLSLSDLDKDLYASTLEV